MHAATGMAIFGIPLDGDVVSAPVTQPNEPGLEYTLSLGRLHYTLPTGQLHFTLSVGRLHFTLPEEDGP